MAICFGLLNLSGSFEPVEGASSMLAGVSMAPSASTHGSVFGSNASVSVDSFNGMSRIHGSGLHLSLDLLEILTQRGIFRISPTHTEFQQAQSSAVWAQLYSNDEMTVYYDNVAVVQLAGGESSSLTVNGVGYFTDIALDKGKSSLLGMALCRLHVLLKGGKCDSASFTTIHDVLVAVVQDGITLAEQVKSVRSSGGGSTEVGSVAAAAPSGGSGSGIDEKQLQAHIKMALSKFETSIVESKPMKDVLKRQEEGVKKAAQESEKKAEDLSMKLQAGVATLSKDTEAARSKLQILEERVSKAEAEGGSALRDDVERVRGQVKEMDSSFSTSLEDLRKRTDKGHETLKATVTESASAVTEGLKALREEGHTNLTTANLEFSAAMVTLRKDLSAATEGQLQQGRSLDQVNATVTALSASSAALPSHYDLEQLSASLRHDYSAAHTTISSSVEVVNSSVCELASSLSAHVDKTATDISEVSNNISTAVARGNGILSKVIGEMNLTIQGSIRNMESLAKEVQRVELTGLEEAKAWAEAGDEKRGEAVAELSASIALVQKEATERAHEHAATLDRRLQAVNATALDKMDVLEGRLLQGVDEIAREVSLVEKGVKDMLAQHAVETEKHIQAANATAAAALASALESVSQEVEALQAGVASQLSELSKTISSLSETSSVAREVLGERVNALQSRVSKEEEESTRAIETSAQNREKISKMEGQLSQCEARGKEAVEDNAKMRDRLTKLETLVEMLMKK